VMMYVRFPILLRQAEDLLYERGIDISYETVRAWWNRLAAFAEWRQISA
jgi:putative transposase